MSLEIMTLEEYRETIDSKFVRTPCEPPERLNPKYFKEDGKGNPKLEEMLRVVQEIWQQVTKKKPLGFYITGSNATGNYRIDSDLDIAILYKGTLAEARQIAKKMNQKNFGKLNPVYRQALKQFKKGKKDFVDISIHIVKPFGRLYDLQSKQWITYGKTEKDHNEYEWGVLGIQVD
jgi:predicted nucleotidyltransferase